MHLDEQRLTGTPQGCKTYSRSAKLCKKTNLILILFRLNKVKTTKVFKMKRLIENDQNPKNINSKARQRY